jgi:hypothetical protein
MAPVLLIQLAGLGGNMTNASNTFTAGSFTTLARTFFIIALFYGTTACQKSPLSNDEAAGLGTGPDINIAPKNPDSTVTQSLKSGIWGSDDTQFSVATDSANLNFGCGNAMFSKSISLNADNTFDIDGTYQSGGGAMPVGGFTTSPIHLHGVVAGDVLTLNTVDAKGAIQNTVTLTFGFSKRMTYCN